MIFEHSLINKKQCTDANECENDQENAIIVQNLLQRIKITVGLTLSHLR